MSAKCFFKDLFLPKPDILLLWLFVFLSGCSNSYTGGGNIGASEAITPGLPFIMVGTSSNVTEEGDTQALIYLSIAESSLIFKNEMDSLVSRVSLNIEIQNSNKENVINKMEQLQFLKDPSSNYYDRKKIYREKTFALPPGEYKIKTTIRDLNSQKETTSENELEIPDPIDESVFISNIRFYKKLHPDSNFISVNGFNVNRGYDSLKFTYQITLGEEFSPLQIESKLIEYETDTSPAQSMTDRNPRSTTIEYKGVDYSEYEILQTTSRTLNTFGSVTIENSFEELPNGNYRFEVAASSPEGDAFFGVRDFSIKSENYPQVKSAVELARPLYYLMSKGEYEDLLSINSEDSLKLAIDSYWLTNIKNTTTARTLIRMYYERVEEANVQFGTYKEGWKTDPGMIYILFGPPLYVDDGFGEMAWIYEFDSGSRNPSIYFEDTQHGNTMSPFQNYMLRRSQSLFNLQYRQIQSWRDGSILYLSQ
ncbi:MAG: GWxTD domain-containing protein [Candidatus Paceibacterota bacterium]